MSGPYQHNSLAITRANLDSRFSLQYPSSPTDSSSSRSGSSLSVPLTPYRCSSSNLHSHQLPPWNELPCGRFPRESDVTSNQHTVSTRMNIAHPYARLYAKKEGKRRKIWNHALEKSLFNPYELSTLGAPHRRTIYMASLEAHVDRLHAQLLSIGFWPVAFDELEPFKGLNSKTAKSMVAGLQHDASHAKLKLLELERANEGLRKTLAGPEIVHTGEPCVSFDHRRPD